MVVKRAGVGSMAMVVLAAGSGCSSWRTIDPSEATIDQYIRIRAPISGRLAPNGDYYYIDRHDGVYQLFRRPAGRTRVKTLTTFADGVNEYTLSPDGRWIAVTAGYGGDEQFNIHLLETSTDNLTGALVDRETVFGSVVWNRQSTAFAYRANTTSKEDFYVYVYDMQTRTSREIWNKPGYWSPVDFNLPGDKLVIARSVSAAEGYLWEVSLGAANARPITSLEESWAFEGVGYAPDDARFYVVSDYQGDRLTLQEIEPQTGYVRPLLPGMAEHEVDAAVMNEARDVMAVTFNIDGYGRLLLYRVPGFEPMPGPVIPDGVVGGVDFQGNDIVFAMTNARTPGATYRWALGSESAEPRLLSDGDTQGIDVAKFRLPELVHYPSFDGLQIPAFLYVPADYQPGTPIPFIISYHGGPEGQYRPRFSEYLQYFVSRGFGVLAPNVRGSSGYGTPWLEMDNYKNRMDSVRDGVAAARWLIDQHFSAPKMVAAYGGSYGGFMTMAVITQAPEMYGAACNYVGIVNFETFLERTKSYRRKLREAEYGPLDDAEFLRSISPIYLVDRIETPLFIAHGKNDPRVPLHEAEQLRDALQARGRTPEFVVFDDEGHGFQKENNRIVFYARLAEFFERHLRQPTG
ncbi:MAG: S9 family peptidase [Phycisphaerales bacterium]|nr:S9 family peptidase [Phycisphaerales bacterium]